MALLTSFGILGLELLVPGAPLHPGIQRFLDDIDFNQMLLRGMLAFLLFAGALHLDLEGLLDNKFTIGALATVGVALSTA